MPRARMPAAICIGFGISLLRIERIVADPLRHENFNAALGPLKVRRHSQFRMRVTQRTQVFLYFSGFLVLIGSNGLGNQLRSRGALSEHGLGIEPIWRSCSCCES